MKEPDSSRLRQTFNEDAALYDRARPGYPPQMFEDLFALARLGPGSRVLEIGCGTGQATVPLAERGCEIVAIELGAYMARVARNNLARFPSVRVVVSSFEEWPLPPEPFDAVVSATAFHWIDPAVRVSKAADALRPGGALITIGTHHVMGGDVRFFAESQRCYTRWDPTSPTEVQLSPASDIPFDTEELDHSNRFEPAVFRRYERDLEYTTQQYIDLLLTYSGHRALEEEARNGLLRCIADLIDTRFGGQIAKRYLTELRLARLRMG